MRLKASIAAGLLLIATACPAARINREPVSAEQRVQAHRLTTEGSLLLREGKDHLALLKFVEASTLNPYDPLIFNKLAITYSRLLRFRQAQKAIRRALQLDPDYAHAHNTQGILHLAARKEAEAIRSFRKAIRLEPKKAIFYVNLGTAYLNRGKFREGRQAYHQALALDPGILKFEDVIQIAASPQETAPEKHFQMSLLFAETGDLQNSLYYLAKALADGFRDAERLAREPAFSRLRQSPEFLSLLRSYGLSLEDGRVS